MRKNVWALMLIVVLVFSFVVPVNATETEDVDAFSVVNLVSLFAEQAYKFGVTSEQMKNRALEYILDNKDTNLDNILKAMFEGMDDYSVYFTEEEYAEFLDSVNASLCGIGVSVVMNGKGASVLEVIPFSPSEKAGLKKYDVLVSADGVELAGKTVSEATALMKGKAGTSVRVGVRRYGAEDILYFDIVRGNVEMSPVYWEKLDDETAYISISTLTVNADFFMKEALAEIDKAGITKILLDLRDNPGGHITSTVNICEMFMPEGPVGYVDYKDPEKLETHYSENKKPKYTLAVLINGNTASGAEFLSGGLQDTRVGVLFGETSFGKGTVQTTRPLANGGAIKLTIAKYYTAGKQDVAKNKIVPDFEVKNSYKQLKDENFEKLDFETKFDIGSSGKGVLAIEQRLTVLGYLDEADENFTLETMEAVRTFKGYNGMMPDPVVDFDFIAYLNNIEYSEKYIEVDRQLNAAYDYLKGLEK